MIGPKNGMMTARPAMSARTPANAERHEVEQRRDPVEEAEQEGAADEAAERLVRALPEQLGLAAQLLGERARETSPERLAVHQHDEGDDQDERRVEQDGRGRGHEPERVARDASRGVAETLR